MAKKETTPSFIIELELKTSKKDEHILNKRIKLAIMLYNMALNYSNKRLKAVRADKEYRVLLKEKKKLKAKEDKERIQAINERLKEIEANYGYSENQVQKFTNKGYKHYDGIDIGSDIVQKIVSRAFKSVEKVKYGKAKRVHFKSIYTDEFSVENKKNGRNITYRNGITTWAKLELVCIII